MNFRKQLKKIIIGTACFTVLATGIGALQQPSAHAATATVSASATSTQKANAIIALSKQLKGKVRYKFGVNNPSKLWFDCSSFTKYVFGKQGVKLKWGSQAQSKQGVYVSKSNLKKAISSSSAYRSQEELITSASISATGNSFITRSAKALTASLSAS